MAYEVTATRRRPQQFKNLVGQEFVASTLSNSISSGKIAHAYLFSGPRGCGKTSTARILAKSLNCQNGPTATPCGVCSNCQEITKGTSLDVIEIDGASNTSVENIRQIKDEVLFPPSNSKYKIYIIDEVHMLSTSAFNALLKTIEEPPPYVIFIFATTELQKVPATIKSRCQQFNFRLVAIDKVKQCLAEAAAELNIQADDEALFWVARESTGSMRDAYTLFDQVVAFSDGHITYEKIRDKLGLVGVERLNALFENCVSKNPLAVSDLLDEYIQNGVSIEQLVTNSADYLRSLLLIKNGVKKESLLGNSVDRYSAQVLNAWNVVQIERGLSIFLNLYRDIRYSLSPRYELELAFSRICCLVEYVSSSEVKKAIDAASALLMKGAQMQNSAATNSASQNATNVNGAFSAAGNFSGGNTSSGAVNTNSGANFSDTANSSSGANFSAAGASTGGANSGGGANFSSGGAANSGGETFNANGSEIHIPAGLPKLSMLGNADSYSEPESRNFGTASASQGNYENSETYEEDYSDYSADEGGGEPSPFPDGGSLPPEQTAFESVPHDDGNFGFNESETSVKNEYDAPVQLEESFSTARGNEITIAQLRGSVMAALSITDGFAASALEKTGAWKITDESVETTVQNNYDYELVTKKSSVISEEISKACSRPMKFDVKIEEIKLPENHSVELPQPVKILVNVFKGTVVAGKI